MKPFVSIVILNWNGRTYLQQFLPSILASTYENYEVVIADNGSTDDSVAFTEQHFPSVKIIRFDKNYGFARGYNIALEKITGDYFVLLNSDVEVSPGWIEPVIALMEGNDAIAAAQPKILQYKNREIFEYAGGAGGWLDFLGYPFTRGRIFDFCEKDSGQYDNAEPIFWASGAALFVRAGSYRSVNGLDEYFFAHQEEIDFCWRLQSAGYMIYSCPQSVVFHVGGGTLPKGNARKVFLNFRNNLIMMSKNLPVLKAVLKISFRLSMDIVSAVKSLLGGEGTYFIAVFRAHIAFFRWLAGKKDRRFFQKPGAPLRGYLKKSVVWSHFIMGKKTFSEIVERKG